MKSAREAGVFVAASRRKLILCETDRVAKISAGKVGSGKPSASKLGTHKRCSNESCPLKVCVGEIRSFKSRPRTISAHEHSIGEVAAAEVRIGHSCAGKNAAGKIALFANAAIGGGHIDARLCPERPEGRSLAGRNRPDGGYRECGEAQLCQHGAGLGALKFSRQ